MRDAIRFCIIFVLFVSIVSFTNYYYKLSVVSGDSMEPTYSNNDLVIVDVNKEPEVGDIVILFSEHMQKTICKRLIGVGGNHIVLTENGIENTGVLLPEYYDGELEWCKSEWQFNPIDVRVPLISVYVLGDNRRISADSRMFGCFEKSQIQGVCTFNISKATGLSFVEMKAFVLTIWMLFLLLPIYTFISDGIIMRKFKLEVYKK